MFLPNDCKIIIFKYLPKNQQLQSLIVNFCRRCSCTYGSLGPMYAGDMTDYSQFTGEKMVEKAQAKVQKLKLLLQTFGLDCIVNDNVCYDTYWCDIKIIHKILVTDKMIKQIENFY